MVLKKYFYVFLVIGIIAGCSKPEPDKTPIARLDDKTLSLEEIRAQLDTTRELSLAQVQQFVQRWLTEETLYREGLEQGLDKSEDLNRKVENAKRQLVVNALLEKEVYSPQLTEISKQDIEQYYNEHKSEFNLTNDVAVISYVLFKNRDAATEFRNAVVKGASWKSAVAERSASIVLRLDSSFQTQATLLPAELWRVASNSSISEISYPINTKNGYYVLTLWRYFKQGQPADISFVEQEIRGRLIIEKRRQIYNQLIQKLRAKHAVEIYIDSTASTEKNNSEN